MMDRWLTRWANNVQRYADLSCVKLILPWSTAAMRFCTSELKTAIICRDLVKRFPGQTILSAAGIRRDESTTRARAPITKAQPKLTNATHSTSGLDWNPILDWSRDQVLAYHEERGFPLHEAYTRYGSSRVSCAFCVLASKRDLAASVSCADNQDIYREMVDLEIASTFSFQERWLADTAPHILTDQQRDLVEGAKRRAERRVKAESRIPKHLLYTKGWPTCMPTYTEAVLLAEVRHEVAEAVGLEIGYTDPERILERYAELMAANERKNGASAESVLVQGVLL
jgi:3'-phosphoadenosine 5'-phosphosulfate sulfotransferase (PAPS reductase)/FAD synthetase